MRELLSFRMPKWLVARLVSAKLSYNTDKNNFNFQENSKALCIVGLPMTALHPKSWFRV